MDGSMLDGLEKLFLALSDKTRLRLLSLMVDGEVSVGYLADTLGESQPKISRHLAYLRSAELVSTRRDGKWVYYGIDTHNDAAVARVLEATLRSILSDGMTPSSPRSFANESDTYVDAYIDDWRPNEMEVWLL